MRQFQDKKKFRSRLYSKVVIILLIIIALLLLKAVVKIYFKEVESRNLRDMAKQRFDNVKLREESLSTQIETLKSPEGIEEEIRSKFNVVKPGEQVILIVPEEEVAVEEPEPSFFEKITMKIKAFFK